MNQYPTLTTPVAVSYDDPFGNFMRLTVEVKDNGLLRYSLTSGSSTPMALNTLFDADDERNRPVRAFTVPLGPGVPASEYRGWQHVLVGLLSVKRGVNNLREH